ncbi:MAG TPA: iron-sulfur cluster insertion protein ErpA [SAR86 cluster bacterium]|jgi:iron-sulfur cluster insertion protein|nr:iron-sulfur cluster insertion protein ErpA [SAR86 cluster bacterium]HJM14919.1 iron-sulfur cluster insertion protein ErpA [SAR86 cluster bacterium]HJM59623.1 iron-sulfur cluster insertion protein ErpA [SAR86 cluster bacterium]|tara:strand:- start:1315 stop:1665 length:351 start_codon:yes stop_codon:yes gene_type:complete
MVESYVPSVIQISDGAVNKILSLANSEDDSNNLNLRVYVTGGGCSGFQYGFSFDKVIDEEDTCITKDGANLVIDSLSLQYLEGSTVDYTEDLMGSKFVITNPNATTTCGCGESFSI